MYITAARYSPRSWESDHGDLYDLRQKIVFRDAYDGFLDAVCTLFGDMKYPKDAPRWLYVSNNHVSIVLPS